MDRVLLLLKEIDTKINILNQEYLENLNIDNNEIIYNDERIAFLDKSYKEKLDQVEEIEDELKGLEHSYQELTNLLSTLSISPFLDSETVNVISSSSNIKKEEVIKSKKEHLDKIKSELSDMRNELTQLKIKNDSMKKDFASYEENYKSLIASVIQRLEATSSLLNVTQNYEVEEIRPSQIIYNEPVVEPIKITPTIEELPEEEITPNEEVVFTQEEEVIPEVIEPIKVEYKEVEEIPQIDALNEPTVVVVEKPVNSSYLNLDKINWKPEQKVNLMKNMSSDKYNQLIGILSKYNIPIEDLEPYYINFIKVGEPQVLDMTLSSLVGIGKNNNLKDFSNMLDVILDTTNPEVFDNNILEVYAKGINPKEVSIMHLLSPYTKENLLKSGINISINPVTLAIYPSEKLKEAN